MSDNKGIIDKIFHPKPVWILFLVISTIMLLIYSLGYPEMVSSFVRYFSYLYSTFSLIVVVMNIKRFSQFLKNAIISNKLFQKIRDFFYKNKTIERFFKDIPFRMLVFLYLTSTINALFAIYNIVNGVRYQSKWFTSVGIYYIILILTKHFIMRHLKKEHDIDYEYKIYRNIGCIMLVLNIILTVMIVQMIRKNVATVYPGHIIYLNALYSFYCIITAVVNMFRFRRFNSPKLSAAKSISLLTSLVSILMLQSTMIATFGENEEDFRKLMNTLTGTGVSVIIIIVALHMIIKGNMKIKNIPSKKEE